MDRRLSYGQAGSGSARGTTPSPLTRRGMRRIFACGAVAMENKLHVYYGGADSYVNVASADLDKFLYEMKHNQDPKLKRVQSPLFN